MAVEQLQKFTNNATTTVPGTISNVATSIVVNTGTGALFPVLSGSLFFAATIVNTISSDPGFGQLEIVKVTARTADTMTIERAQEGTTAKSFPAGCLFELRPTAQAFDNIYTEVLELESTKAPIASPVFTGNPQAPTPTLGDDDTSIANTEFVRTAVETYGNGYVNMIINPHGSIRQESSSPLTGSASGYFADQWTTGFVAAGAAWEVNVVSGGISAYDLQNMYMKTTTVKASLAATDIAFLLQPVEGYEHRRLQYGTGLARGSWLRFRASCSQSATVSFSIRNASVARSYVQSFAVTTTPTDYSFFIPGDTSGTWEKTTSVGAFVGFTLAAGTTYQTATLGAWQAGDFRAANTQTNLLGTLNAQLNITDVQWNDAPILLPFYTIDYPSELDRCQRYFEPISINGHISYNQNTTSTICDIVFNTTKRTTTSLNYVGAMPTGENTCSPTAVSLDRNRIDGVQLVWTGTAGALGAGTCGRLLVGGVLNFSARM